MLTVAGATFVVPVAEPKDLFVILPSGYIVILLSVRLAVRFAVEEMK